MAPPINGALRWYAYDDEASGDVRDILEYENWLGTDLQIPMWTQGKDKWSRYTEFNGDYRGFDQWVQNGSDRAFSTHVSAIPTEVTDNIGTKQGYQNIVDGFYDDKYENLGQELVDGGFHDGNYIMRLNNEFNIRVPHSPMDSDGNIVVEPPLYKEACQRIINIMRDYLGDELTVVWSPLLHSTQINPSTAVEYYPRCGVDIGGDIYDKAPAYGDPNQAPNNIDYANATESEKQTVREYTWQNNMLTGDKYDATGIGLNDIANWADRENVDLWIPEWGCNARGTQNGYAGGDNDYYVKKMYEWMDNNDVIGQMYFSSSGNDLSSGNFPDAASAFKSKFGGLQKRSVNWDEKYPDTGYVTNTAGGVVSTLNGVANKDRSTQSGNFVFVTSSELDTQKQRADNNEEPWATAYNNLIADADNALNTTLKSVTDDDGDHNFTKGESDYPNAIDMSAWARDCALAYQLTGDDKYADRAVEIIHHWCLKDSTYMVPTTEVVNNNQTIRQHITMPAFMYAASMVRGNPAWDNYDGSRPWDGGDSGDAESAFKQWVRDRHDTFVDSRPGVCEYNNKWSWRITDRAASGAYLQDDAKVDFARSMWKADAGLCDDGTKRPWNDFVNNYKDFRAYDGSSDPNNNGLFVKEFKRSDAFHYTQYNLKAIADALLIFDRYDDTGGPWDYNADSDNKSGASLWKAVNWFEDWIQDTGAWTFDDNGTVDNADVEGAASVYELFYDHYDSWFGAVNNPSQISGRPHYDIRLLGHVTFTHGAPPP